MMENVQSFTFFDGYYEAIKDLKDKDKKEILLAIIEYVFENKEPNFKGVKNSLWVLIKPSLDVSKTRSKSKQNKIKSKSKQNQNEIKTKSNEDENKIKTKSNQDDCSLLEEEIEIEEEIEYKENNKCCNNNKYNTREKELFNSNNIFITPANFEIFNDICESYSYELIEEAVKRACNQNNRNLRYVDGILRSWKAKGYSTLEEVKKELGTSAEDRVKRVLGGKNERKRTNENDKYD